MSSLVKEFQRDILQASKRATELLQTAKLISVKLSLDDITSWVNSELSGYENPADIPPYRLLSGGELQTYNPMRGWLPVEHVSRKLRMCQPLSSVEELCKSETVIVPLTGDEKYQLSSSIGSSITHWQQCIRFHSSQIKPVIEAVRNQLLDWSLELEKRGIVGEDMSFDEKERTSAQNQTFHIQNFTGVFGDVSHSNVQIYDYSSLHDTLKQQNVPQAERNELENIMDGLRAAPPAKKAGLMERGKAWVVRNREFLGATASIVRKALGVPDEWVGS